MKIRELGEFGLIQRIAQKVAQAGLDRPISEAGFPLILGIGDDAAAWKTAESIQLLTTDTLVENIHFPAHQVTWQELGWKALAVNLSDIAAMGGRPLYAIVTLGLPEETQVEDIDNLYDGMIDLCKAYSVALVGGDLVRSLQLFITVALAGVASGPLLTRSAALPGDAVAVTGPVGASAAGLKMLLEGLAFPQETFRFLRQAHLRPAPRVDEGQLLAREGVLAAIDISDGLLDDLSKLCTASNVSSRIHAAQIPVHPILKAAFPEGHLGLALAGGEDYELLFTTPKALLERLVAILPSPPYVIGQVEAGPPGRVALIDSHGKEIAWSRGGWDHFG